MFEDLPAVLRLLGSTCATVEATLPKGTVERRQLRCAQQLTVQAIIENWEAEKYADELRPRFDALISATDRVDDAHTLAGMRRLLANMARSHRAGGKAVEALIDLEYDIHSRTEQFYKDQLSRLGRRDEAEARDPEYDGNVFARFLSDAAGSIPVSVTSMRRAPGGFSKITLVLSIESGGVYPPEVVVRLDRKSGHLGTSVSSEYTVIERLYEAGVKVPRPLAQDSAGETVGVPFIVVGAVPGTTIGDMFNLPDPNPAISNSIAVEMAKLHLAPVDPIKSALKNVGTAREQVEAWLVDSVTAWKELEADSAIMDAGFDWLSRNLHLAEGDAVVIHGDMGLNNILIDGAEVSAILDWEFVGMGHAGYDLGYFHCMATALGTWEGFLAAYERGGGIVPSAETLDFFILFANVRLATWIWQAAAVFERRKSSEIIFVTPSAHDKRIQTMRVAEQLTRIRASKATQLSN